MRLRSGALAASLYGPARHETVWRLHPGGVVDQVGGNSPLDFRGGWICLPITHCTRQWQSRRTYTAVVYMAEMVWLACADKLVRNSP